MLGVSYKQFGSAARHPVWLLHYVPIAALPILGLVLAVRVLMGLLYLYKLRNVVTRQICSNICFSWQMYSFHQKNGGIRRQRNKCIMSLSHYSPPPQPPYYLSDTDPPYPTTPSHIADLVAPQGGVPLVQYAILLPISSGTIWCPIFLHSSRFLMHQ